MDNLYDNLPEQLPRETFTDLLNAGSIRIERILSRGQTSPETGWYDQHEHEWVILLEGAAELTFSSGDVITLRAGDYLNIPAHTPHRVSWTDQHLAGGVLPIDCPQSHRSPLAHRN